MERRRFMKLAVGASLTAAFPLPGNTHASRVPLRAGRLVSGPRIKVFLAGVNLDPPLFNKLIGDSLNSFNSANPDKATAMTYLFHGVGLFGLGLGLFTVAISYKPYRRNEKWAWYMTLYLPIILLIAAVANYADGGQSWTGGLIFLIISLAGLLLPYRKFFPKK